MTREERIELHRERINNVITENEQRRQDEAKRAEERSGSVTLSTSLLKSPRPDTETTWQPSEREMSSEKGMSRAERIKLHQARIDKIIQENERRRQEEAKRSTRYAWDLIGKARNAWSNGEAFETGLVYMEARRAYAVPISKAETPERFTPDDQGYLMLRALFADCVVSLSSVTTTESVTDYRRGRDHDEIRERLTALLDERSSQSESILVARLTPPADRYEVMVSTFETSQSETAGPQALDEGMKLALQMGKTVVTDLSTGTQAVYVPRRFGDKTVGFLVMTKRSWTPETRRVKAVTTSQRVSSISSSDRMELLEKRLEELEKRVSAMERQTTSTRQDRPQTEPKTLPSP